MLTCVHTHVCADVRCAHAAVQLSSGHAGVGAGELVPRCVCRCVCTDVCAGIRMGTDVHGARVLRRVCKRVHVCAQVGTGACADARAEMRVHTRMPHRCAHTPGAAASPRCCPPSGRSARSPAGKGHPATARSGGRRRAGCALNVGTWRRSVCAVCACMSLRVPMSVCARSHACARLCLAPCPCVSPCVPAPGPAPALPITRRPL